MKTQLENLMDVNGVIEHFGISRSTLYRLTKNENQLPYVKIGRRKLFKITDLSQLIDKNYSSTQL